jgi:hypothetical protein
LTREARKFPDRPRGRGRPVVLGLPVRKVIDDEDDDEDDNGKRVSFLIVLVVVVVLGLLMGEESKRQERLNDWGYGDLRHEQADAVSPGSGGASPYLTLRLRRVSREFLLG